MTSNGSTTDKILYFTIYMNHIYLKILENVAVQHKKNMKMKIEKKYSDMKQTYGFSEFWSQRTLLEPHCSFNVVFIFFFFGCFNWCVYEWTENSGNYYTKWVFLIGFSLADSFHCYAFISSSNILVNILLSSNKFRISACKTNRRIFRNGVSKSIRKNWMAMLRFWPDLQLIFTIGMRFTSMDKTRIDDIFPLKELMNI